MPKSKRAKAVALTKTDSKGSKLKTDLVQNVRDAVDEFSHIYVFSYKNMRSTKFKKVRADFRDSRYITAESSLLSPTHRDSQGSRRGLAGGDTPRRHRPTNTRVATTGLANPWTAVALAGTNTIRSMSSISGRQRDFIWLSGSDESWTLRGEEGERKMTKRRGPFLYFNRLAGSRMAPKER